MRYDGTLVYTAVQKANPPLPSRCRACECVRHSNPTEGNLKMSRNLDENKTCGLDKVGIPAIHTKRSTSSLLMRTANEEFFKIIWIFR